ncbi:hypothetical protein BT69DRAFT_1289047 [Atractiella rhizophila]|nr:hypothetical protein BT69DRAFT_1289047 [Atractiella rhizophila]
MSSMNASNSTTQKSPIAGLLPAPSPVVPSSPSPTASSDEAGVGQANEGRITLDLSAGSSRVSLYDELGPTVINLDGTLSRISNWKEMSTMERERTVMILGKRNAIRKADLEVAAQKPMTGVPEKLPPMLPHEATKGGSL